MSVRTTTISLILDSTGLVVEHAMWRVTARYIGPAFPRGIKSSCGRPGAGSLPKQSKYGKTNEFSCESEGKHFRQASKVPYLRKARASALQYMQLPDVCIERGNHGWKKTSAKCLLQISRLPGPAM